MKNGLDRSVFKPNILLIEDDEIMRITVSDNLRKRGWAVDSAVDGIQGIKLMRKKDFDIVICDIRLPKKNGMELLKEAIRLQSGADFIMMTAYGRIEDAVEAIRLGAYDYITKPFHMDELVIRIKRIMEHKLIQMRYRLLKKDMQKRYSYQNIIGESKRMQDVFNIIEKVSKIDSNIIIFGESGTGKGLVANVIHNLSVRKDKPFIKVNCAVLTETLMESELFGHEKGAFTGAIRKKYGRFELANEGTIFFDEVADIPRTIQGKLLRVIQEHEFERVGGEDTIAVDVRLISATNKDLEGLVASGGFREDLYFRLKVIPIYLPPLRERKEDIPLLIEEFLKRFNKKLGRSIAISREATRYLMDYNYPGNVREMENIMERAVALSDNVIRPSDIFFINDEGSQVFSEKIEGSLPLKKLLQKTEKAYLLKVLEETKWNKAEASRALGISRKNLWEKLKSYNLLK